MNLDGTEIPELRLFAERCVNCNLCLQGCMMSKDLEEGPGKMVSRFLMDGAVEDDWAFRCSLCGYCSQVCPVGADLRSVVTALRRRACEKPSPRMRRLFAGVLLFQYLASWRSMGTPPVFPQERGRRLFFPGCAMASSDPALVLMVWRALRSYDPNMGIMVGCCGTPAQSLGRRDVADKVLAGITRSVRDHGIEEIVVACPNCLKALSVLPVSISPVWRLMEEVLPPARTVDDREVMFHAPCPLRDREGDLAEVKGLIASVFPSVRTEPYGGKGGFCCGAGGMVPIVHPELFSRWSGKISGYRRDDEIVVCCCQSCVDALGGRDSDVVHVLRILLGGEAPPPPTSLGRWRNRRKLRKAILDGVEAHLF